MDPRAMPDSNREMATFVSWVKKEHKRLEDQGESYTIPLRQRILKGWEVNQPQMLARLNKAGVAQKLADVLQARMWQAAQEYLDSGMPLSDAREQAEREWLWMEPEEASGTTT